MWSARDNGCSNNENGQQPTASDVESQRRNEVQCSKAAHMGAGLSVGACALGAGAARQDKNTGRPYVDAPSERVRTYDGATTAQTAPVTARTAPATARRRRDDDGPTRRGSITIAKAATQTAPCMPRTQRRRRRRRRACLASSADGAMTTQTAWKRASSSTTRPSSRKGMRPGQAAARACDEAEQPQGHATREASSDEPGLEPTPRPQPDKRGCQRARARQRARVSRTGVPG